jgi:hypothetical protein
MENDFENELLNLSNTQRDILDECDDNLERLKITYINTLIDIQHSLNELKKRELENQSYNHYDNYHETIADLLDNREPFEFYENLDRLNTVMEPTYNNTFGYYLDNNNTNTNNTNTNNTNTNNTNTNIYLNQRNIYNNGYRRVINNNNINVNDKSKFKRHNNGSLKECSICYKDKQYFMEILSCKHSFCNGCVKHWIKEHQTCPMCRTNI